MRAQILLACGLLLPFASAQESESPFEVVLVRPNIYLLANLQGNVTVQVGEAPGQDGVLLVNTGPARFNARIASEIRKISEKPIRYIVNTSANADEIANNATFARLDPAAPAAVFAQDNVLTRMSNPAASAPQVGWPTITFESMKNFVFNGEAIQIYAEKRAVTDGDSIVLFRGSNVISAGQVFLTTSYPAIDLQRGGTINGELKALNHILDLAIPKVMQEGGTMVIPGQGRLCDQADVVEYRDMLTIIRDRVADSLKKGQTFAQVKAARFSRDFDGRFSAKAMTGDMLVEAMYKSLLEEKSK